MHDLNGTAKGDAIANAIAEAERTTRKNLTPAANLVTIMDMVNELASALTLGKEVLSDDTEQRIVRIRDAVAQRTKRKIKDSDPWFIMNMVDDLATALTPRGERFSDDTERRIVLIRYAVAAALGCDPFADVEKYGGWVNWVSAAPAPARRTRSSAKRS